MREVGTSQAMRFLGTSVLQDPDQSFNRGPDTGQYGEVALVWPSLKSIRFRNARNIFANTADKAIPITNVQVGGSAAFATSFFSDDNMSAIMNGTCPDGFNAEDKSVARQMKSLSRTAPIALKMASDLIDATVSTSLADGLQMELDHLTEIFSTQDSLEGLSALIEGRKPTYTNN